MKGRGLGFERVVGRREESLNLVEEVVAEDVVEKEEDEDEEEEEEKEGLLESGFWDGRIERGIGRAVVVRAARRGRRRRWRFIVDGGG